MALRFAFLLCACLSVAGCLMDSGHARVSADYAVTVKKVGVMTLVDDRPSLNYLEGSAMESNFASAVLPGWRADELVQAALTSRLSRKGYEVVKLAPDARIRDAYGKTWRLPIDENLRAALYELGSALALDLIVVACREIESDLVTGTHQNIQDYGLQKAADTGPFAYALIYVEALDIKGRFAVGQAQGLQSAPLPAALWQADFETTEGEIAIAPANQSAVHDALARLLGTAVGIAAQEAGL